MAVTKKTNAGKFAGLAAAAAVVVGGGYVANEYYAKPEQAKAAAAEKAHKEALRQPTVSDTDAPRAQRTTYYAEAKDGSDFVLSAYLYVDCSQPLYRDRSVYIDAGAGPSANSFEERFMAEFNPKNQALKDVTDIANTPTEVSHDENGKVTKIETDQPQSHETWMPGVLKKYDIKALCNADGSRNGDLARRIVKSMFVAANAPQTLKK
jgi:hypothetical protein